MGTDSWLILRCSGRHTMSLAASLAEDGFEVWTPVEVRKVQIAKTNVKRDMRQAILPGFVFARWDHLVDMLELAAMPAMPRRGLRCQKPAHRSFSILRQGDRIAAVADHHLSGLRTLERRRTPKRKAEPLPLGSTVRVNGGPFSGMHGIIKRSDDVASIICFSAWFDKVEIETSLLSIDDAYGEQAARKAA